MHKHVRRRRYTMMRVVVTAVVILFGAFATAGDKKADPLSKDAKKELERLQGEWALTEVQRAGKKFELSDFKPALEIKGTKWILTGQHKSAFIAIHPETDPKCFDLKSVEEARKGEVHEGIYKIAGDTLTICIHEGKDKQRPTRFEATAEQPNTILVVLKRVKKE
jgi:uncharacterized protein (TIGR03067 family)